MATKTFSPAIIAQSEGWIRQQCEELLPYLSAGSIEFVGDFLVMQGCSLRNGDFQRKRSFCFHDQHRVMLVAMVQFF